MIRVWDIESSKCVFEFSNAHGDTGITAMAFDSTERRYKFDFLHISSSIPVSSRPTYVQGAPEKMYLL